uniref:Uncharacterized protein n=1 Tax=Rhizophora mucronata TaxID=61149 RepID=A0A2P2INV4_RHIMU
MIFLTQPHRVMGLSQVLLQQQKGYPDFSGPCSLAKLSTAKK